MENIVLGDHTLSIEDLAQLIANEKATMKTIALNNKKLLFITLKNGGLSHFLVPQDTKEALKGLFNTTNQLSWRKYVHIGAKQYILFYEADGNKKICHILDENGQYPEPVKGGYIRHKLRGRNSRVQDYNLIYRTRISDGKINWIKDQMYSEEGRFQKDTSYDSAGSSGYMVFTSVDGSKILVTKDYENNSFKILGSYSEIAKYRSGLIGFSRGSIVGTQKATYYAGEDMKSGNHHTKQRHIKTGEGSYLVKDIQDIIGGEYGTIVVTRSSDEVYRIWDNNGQEIQWEDVSINEEPKYETNTNRGFFIISNGGGASHIIQDVSPSKKAKQNNMINVQGEYKGMLGDTYLYYSDGEKDILLYIDKGRTRSKQHEEKYEFSCIEKKRATMGKMKSEHYLMTNQDKGTTSIVQTSFNHFSIISTLTDVHIFEDYVIGISEEGENILFSPLLDDYNLNPDKIIIKYDTLLNYQELLNGDHLPLNHDKKDIVCGYTQGDKTYVIRKYHSSMSLSSGLGEKDRALKEERDDEQKKQKFESTVKQNLADFFNGGNEGEDEDNF